MSIIQLVGPILMGFGLFGADLAGPAANPATTGEPLGHTALRSSSSVIARRRDLAFICGCATCPSRPASSSWTSSQPSTWYRPSSIKPSAFSGSAVFSTAHQQPVRPRVLPRSAGVPGRDSPLAPLIGSLIRMSGASSATMGGAIWTSSPVSAWPSRWPVSPGSSTTPDRLLHLHGIMLTMFILRLR